MLIPVAVFLFLIKLFGDLNRVWFHWPVSALLLIAFLQAAFPRKPS